MCVTETRRIISENISLLPKILTQRKIEVLYIGLCLVQEEVSEKFFFSGKNSDKETKTPRKSSILLFALLYITSAWRREFSLHVYMLSEFECKLLNYWLYCP